jgi:hypothetical protein
LATALVLQLVLSQALTADRIVIDPGALDPELARVTLESCTEATSPGQCVADTPEATSEQPAWFARVIWDAAQLRARVEIRQGSRDAAPEHVREVEFSTADELPQRHRAVGLIVASYVVERVREHERERAAEQERAREQAAEQARAAAAVAAEEAEARARAEPAAGVDLALLAGPGLDRGPARFGLALRGFARLFDGPIAAALALRAARRGGDVPVLWLGGGAGLLLHVQPDGFPLAFETRAELAAERLSAAADDDATSMHDSDSVWRLGGLLGLELHLPLSSGFSLFAGGDLEWLRPSVSVEVGGQRVGKTPDLTASALIGVRWAR